jgi:metal-responsive CopG/Arc/MetJ family transcriptional regulator
MATSVHIPENLLKEVDRRAKTLKMSRNRYIVEALRKVLADQTSWSAPFLEQLDRLAPVEGVDEMLDGIKARRSRKGPPEL